MKIAFYIAKKGNLLDYIIDKGTGGDGYSHCEMIFDQIVPDVGDQTDQTNQSEQTEQTELCFSISGRDKKARFKFIDVGDHWETIDINMSIEDEKKIYNLCNSYIGLSYDFFGIIFWYIY